MPSRMCPLAFSAVRYTPAAVYDLIPMAFATNVPNEYVLEFKDILPCSAVSLMNRIVACAEEPALVFVRLRLLPPAFTFV
jgi:hypothetical protein